MRGQKRFLSLILAFVMAISLLPATAFAEGEDGTEASDSLGLNGKTFAIVNKRKQLAMLEKEVGNDENGNRAGQKVNLSQAEDESYYVAYWTEDEKNSITQWKFEKIASDEEDSSVKGRKRSCTISQQKMVRLQNI